MISERIKQFRTIRGFSQEKLAEESGLSLRTVQRVENGETEPSGNTLTRLAEALEVTPDDLLEWNRREDNTYLTVLNASALSFILFPLLGVILPLILWITKRDQIKKVDEVGKQLLNFQITWTLVVFFSLFIGYAFWAPHVISSAGDVSPSIVYNATDPVNTFILGLYIFNVFIITINTIRVKKDKRLFYYPRINFMR